MSGRTKIVGILVLVLCFGLINQHSQAAEEVIVSTWGGHQTYAHKTSYFDPFTAETGIRVTPTTMPLFGRVKAMMESGNIEWDVVDLESFSYFQGVKNGYYVPLDYSMIPTKGQKKRYLQKYGAPTSFYSVILAYRKQSYPKGGNPKNWKEFWDVKNFSGRRSLQNYPVGNLEFALLADGVPPEKIYPLDIDRAFRKLDEIKPHIAVWWEAFGQPAELLANGEIDLTSSFNGRINDIQNKEIQAGIVWNGGYVDVGYWSILKGARNVKNAMKFIAFSKRPINEALAANIIAYGPSGSEASKYIPPERARELPTYEKNWKVLIKLDQEWWAENLDKMLERWRSWMIGG